MQPKKEPRFKKSGMKILLTGFSGSHSPAFIEYLLRLVEPDGIIMLAGLNQPVDKSTERLHLLLAIPNSRPEYDAWLLSICRENSVTDLIPLIDSETIAAARLSPKLQEINVRVWTASLEVVSTCVDKALCYYLLPKFAPQYCLVETSRDFRSACEALGAPESELSARPNSGPNGSGKGFRILTKNVEYYNDYFFTSRPGVHVNYDAYEKAMIEAEISNILPQILLTEWLPGQEYSCYLCCNHGEIKGIGIHRKDSYENGTTNTGKATTEEDAVIYKICSEIANSLKLHLLNNIQLKRDVLGNLKLLEVNPRLAGTFLLSERAGLDLIDLGLKVLQHEIFAIKFAKPGFSIERRQVDLFTEPRTEVWKIHPLYRTNITGVQWVLADDQFLKQYDRVILDIDNTIHDEWSYIEAAVNNFLCSLEIENDIGRKSTLSSLRKYYLEHGNKNLFDMVIEPRGYPRKYVNQFLEFLRTSSPKIFLYTEAEAWLRFLIQARINFQFVSDGNPVQQKNKYRLLGLPRFASEDRLLCTDTLGGKISLDAAQALRSKNLEKTLVIGDLDADLILAKNIDADFLLIEKDV